MTVYCIMYRPGTEYHELVEIHATRKAAEKAIRVKEAAGNWWARHMKVEAHAVEDE